MKYLEVIFLNIIHGFPELSPHPPLWGSQNRGVLDLSKIILMRFDSQGEKRRWSNRSGCPKSVTAISLMGKALVGRGQYALSEVRDLYYWSIMVPISPFQHVWVQWMNSQAKVRGREGGREGKNESGRERQRQREMSESSLNHTASSWG